jgi:SH3 domain-containing YSC84-like protein 1
VFAEIRHPEEVARRLVTQRDGPMHLINREDTNMHKGIRCGVFMMVAALLTLPVRAQDKEDSRLRESGAVLKEVLNVPEDIPQGLLDKAECVVVIPSVKKAAFVVGASYGRGAMSCRTGPHWMGQWSAPTMMALEGGSVGFQIGGQATDFVILVGNAHGASSLLSSKVKLGADASAAAGPKGRDAEASTDAYLRAEMLTYSRAQGLFAGVSLEGSTLRPDDDANERIYGKKMSAKDIVLSESLQVPAAAADMVDTLNKRSPKNLSDPKSLE